MTSEGAMPRSASRLRYFLMARFRAVSLMTDACDMASGNITRNVRFPRRLRGSTAPGLRWIPSTPAAAPGAPAP